jgi:hypothetical protein
MSKTQNKQPENIKPGLYTIDKSLLSFLRTVDPNVAADDYCDFYYGPVFVREDGENFFAPVAKNPEMQGEAFLDRRAKGFFGPLNIAKMIPARAKSLTPANSQDPAVSEIEDTNRKLHESIVKFAKHLYEDSEN